jgi:hypothetical protein
MVFSVHELRRAEWADERKAISKGDDPDELAPKPLEKQQRFLRRLS